MKRHNFKAILLATIIALLPSTSAYAENFCISEINTPKFRSFVEEHYNNRSQEFNLTVKNTNISDFDKITGALRKALDVHTSQPVSHTQYGGRFFGGNGEIKVEIAYRTTPEQEAFVDEFVSTLVDEFLSKGEKTQEERIKFVTDTIVLMLEYDQTLQYRTTYDAINKKVAVCEGYARLSKVFYDKLEIPNILLTGYGRNEHHIWNMVKLGDTWLHVDNTWNDPVFPRGNKPKNFISYDFYLKTDLQLAKTHTWSKENQNYLITQAENRILEELLSRDLNTDIIN